jgi:AcrR family transcriptional regulator
MGELRESKKRETRQRISEVATGLFFARGFDAVTIEEIAAAANVSKMTVFNYFARKEDLFLDREEEVKLLLREALSERPKGQSPIDALRHLVDRLCEQKHPTGGASLRRARRSGRASAKSGTRQSRGSRSSSQARSPMASRGSSPA